MAKTPSPAVFSIGERRKSYLPPEEFMAANGASWVLEDGRSIVGSALATARGWTRIPDSRGKFDRMLVGVEDILVPQANISTGDDWIVINDHPYTHGFKVRLTGVAPGGLSLNTDYYVIYIDENTIQLASSLSNAMSDTFIDITSVSDDVTIIQMEDADGGRDVGSIQEDAAQGHKHDFSYAQNDGNLTANGNNMGWNLALDPVTDTSRVLAPIADGVSGIPRVSTETRSKNVASYWYVKIN